MSGNANNSSKPPPLIKAAGLWAKSSVKGGQYLTGRLGGMKVLILENRERKGDDDPSPAVLNWADGRDFMLFRGH
jgi:hypothetical protein